MPRLRSTSHRPRKGERAGPVGPDEVPAEAARVLPALARWAIAQELGEAASRPARADWLGAPGASFVSLTTDDELSGCIGSTSPVRSLGEDVRVNALAAAFRDPRFRPMGRGELARTRIEVTVLSQAVPLPAVDEADALARLRPYVDGLVLEYAGRRATFLPQVWGQLPEPHAFLAALKRKLGLPPAFWADDVRLLRYVVKAFPEEEPR